MSQKERVDLIEVDLLDMCKYILSKWVFILLGMVIFAGAGFGYAKVKSRTEYSSKMQVYVTVPKTSDKVLIRDSASEMAWDYVKLVRTDLVVNKIANKTHLSVDKIKDTISADVIEGTRIVEIRVNSYSRKTTESISREILPVFQNVVVKSLKRDKPIIVDYPSKIEATETISTKRMILMGAASGFLLVFVFSFVGYIVSLYQKNTRK